MEANPLSAFTIARRPLGCTRTAFELPVRVGASGRTPAIQFPSDKRKGQALSLALNLCVACRPILYGTTMTVEPDACAPVDVVMVTVTVIVPLPAAYVLVTVLLVVSAVPSVEPKTQW
jgi:hypothetical protein